MSAIADSPLAGRMIFNTGARRSGTYWLQRIVMAHPDVFGIPSETLLFSHGIAPLLDRFHHGARGSTELGVIYADRAVLIDGIRRMCDGVFMDLAGGPHRHIAERSAPHVQHLDLVSEVYPDARFVHIVRDGRDVTRSLVAQPWGPSTVREAATEWRDSVLAGRRTRDARYLEIRYEDLLADPAARIPDLFDWLGLDVTPEAVDAGLEAAAIVDNADPTDPRAETGKWRSSFSRRDLRDFERIAGDLLAELGYVEHPSPRAALFRNRTESARRRETTGRPVDPADRPHLLVHAANALLGHLHSGDHHAVPELLADDVVVRVVTNSGARDADGAAAHELLKEAVFADPAYLGRQLRGDVEVRRDHVRVSMTYELVDGTVADRELVVALREDEIVGLTVAEGAALQLDGEGIAAQGAARGAR
jgi:Sulfotransferase family